MEIAQNSIDTCVESIEDKRIIHENIINSDCTKKLQAVSSTNQPPNFSEGEIIAWNDSSCANNHTTIALETETANNVPLQQKVISCPSNQSSNIQKTPPSRQNIFIHELEIFDLDIVDDMISLAM